MKLFLTSFFLFSFLASFSQSNEKAQTDTSLQSIDKNELRLNVISFIAFGGLEVDYEHLFSEESSFGISVLISTGNPNDINLIRNFSITPYYRQYFSKKYARGFFVEGFGMVLNREDTFFIFDNDFDNEEETISSTDFALGVSVGGGNL